MRSYSVCTFISDDSSHMSEDSNIHRDRSENLNSLAASTARNELKIFIILSLFCKMQIPVIAKNIATISCKMKSNAFEHYLRRGQTDSGESYFFTSKHFHFRHTLNSLCFSTEPAIKPRLKEMSR
jgi:hypothetical protein